MSNTILLRGVIESMTDCTTTPSGHQIRRFVLFVANERDERYSDHIECELNGANVTKIDQFPVGAQVEVQADVRGRAWTAQDGTVKHFVSINAFNVRTPQATQFSQPYQQPTQYASAPPSQYAGAQPMFGPQSVNYPPTNAAAVAKGEKAVIGQENKQGDLPF